jgi:hypothetical protein
MLKSKRRVILRKYQPQQNCMKIADSVSMSLNIRDDENFLLAPAKVLKSMIPKDKKNNNKEVN